MINFDEWGGFFDHVAPGRAPDADPHNALRGFRVPALVISPRARRGHVDHGVYDHTSLLKAIEWRFGLAPLTPRDRNARNIMHALDFSRPADLRAPTFHTPLPPPTECSVPTAVTENEWTDLRAKALALGWSLPA